MAADMGRWTPEAVTVGEAGDVRLALAGQHALDADELAAAALRVRDVGDVDRFARSLPGSSHVFASLGGRVRAQAR